MDPGLLLNVLPRFAKPAGGWALGRLSQPVLTVDGWDYDGNLRWRTLVLLVSRDLAINRQAALRQGLSPTRRGKPASKR